MSFIVKTLLIFSPSLLCLSCIQIPVGNEKVETYKNVVYQSPQPRFSKIAEFSADQAWMQSETGSIISYKSECSKQAPNSEIFLQNITNEFYTTRESNPPKPFKYNSRKALRQILTTEVEGIPTNFDLVVFKKYGCLFLISHSGVTGTFNKTAPSFDKFLNSFRVQR